ncbi:hypothetical protein BH10PSE1_BH10PSE1_13140 [soil metagenome]
MIAFLAATLLMAQTPTVAVPDASRLPEDRACYTLSITRGTESRPIGVVWQTVARETIDGKPVLRVVVHQSVNGGAFDMRDIFTLDAATLRPLTLENSRKGVTHVVATYGADRITGERHEADGTTAPIDVPLTGPVWEGNLFGQTFAALPLAEGADFTLPYWQYDKGFGDFTVRVTGSETVQTPGGPVEAWVVDAGASADSRLTYLIGKADHRELGYRAGPGSQRLGGDCSALEAIP